MFRIFKNKKEKLAYCELVNHTDWNAMSKRTHSDIFMETFADKLDWNELIMHNTMSMDFIRKNIDRLDIYLLARYQNLDEEFIREYADDEKFLDQVMAHQAYDVNFAREFLPEFKKQLSGYFFRRRTLPNEKVWEEFKDYINWWYLGRHSRLTPHFIEKYIEKFNFTQQDIDEYKLDSERYHAIRRGAYYNKKEQCFLSSGNGIIINPISTYISPNVVLDLWKKGDEE